MTTGNKLWESANDSEKAGLRKSVYFVNLKFTNDWIPVSSAISENNVVKRIWVLHIQQRMGW